MSSRITNIIKTFFTITVLIFFSIFSAMNLSQFVVISKENLNDKSLKESKEAFANIENSFRENVFYRQKLVNAYGLYKKVLNCNIIGNFEYIADEYGILHQINDYSRYDVNHFVEEVIELEKYAIERQIPFVFVQAPNREIVNDHSTTTEFNIDDETMNIVVEALRQSGVSVLDIRDRLKNTEREFELSELFYHTDLHMQTDAEMWMAYQVATYLEGEEIHIEDTKFLTDKSLYDRKDYPLIGNYVRTNGKYFVDRDMFYCYFPKFETAFDLVVPDNPEANKTGNFNEILMNGYEQSEYNEYTYWVTNYMKYTYPYYTYINHNQEDLKVLVITDSIAYRGLAHLSLAVNKLTILDPRYFNGKDYIKQALEEEYDVILLWQGNYLIGNSLLLD